MEQMIRCNVGIDMAKKDFKTVILAVSPRGDMLDCGHGVFANSPAGFKSFLIWCNTSVTSAQRTFTMEFTGRYSDKLAVHLYQQNYVLFMVSPYKSKRFRESYDPDIKTDDRDAQILAIMGLERKLSPWKPDSEFFGNLKIIVRERVGLVKQKTSILNKLHSLKFAAIDTLPTEKRLRERLKLIRKHLREIDKQIEDYLKTDPIVWQKVQNVKTIPGIGLSTIATVLAETDGFAKTTSARKLSAFAGYKVTVKDSGQFKGLGHISKRGNKFIRHAMHMPTLSIIQCNSLLKAKYESLKPRKVKSIIATTAIERKALILIYSIYKNDTVFNANILKKI